MRVIKFKFWNKIENRFQEDLLDSKETYQNPFKREDLILCQFTGLVDCHGKEIYEGDIIRWDDLTHHVQVVKWDYLELGAMNYFKEDRAYGIEVLGNIYENPKLLKKVTKNEKKTS